jgi:chlorite dismutase
MSPRNQYAAWWLYKRSSNWSEIANGGYAEASAEFEHVLSQPGPDVTVRGTYSSLGLSASVDVIVWAHAESLAALQQLAVTADRTSIGSKLALVQCYIGIGGMSQYDPTHGPAFIKGIPPKRYLSVYPFTKTPEWYLVDYQERRRLMVEHGEMGREFPDILTNTVNSFGIQDQEFVVALEDDDPSSWSKWCSACVPPKSASGRPWTPRFSWGISSL